MYIYICHVLLAGIVLQPMLLEQRAFSTTQWSLDLDHVLASLKLGLVIETDTGLDCLFGA